MAKIPFGFLLDDASGEYVIELAIITWLKHLGDNVAKGEEIVEAETNKAIVIIEAPVAGIIVEIYCQDGKEWNPNDDGKTIETAFGTLISPPLGEIETTEEE